MNRWCARRRHLLGKLAALSITALASWLPTRAEAFSHVVTPGETLAQLAARVYGNAKYESVLVAANALDVEGGSAIVTGMRLQIPAPGYHRVTKGETWADLALVYLGERTRAEVLARANDGVSWVQPLDGEQIVIPAVLSFIAGDKDSTVTIARRFLGDANKAWQLDQYNERHGVALRRGEVVLVPLPELSLTELGRADARRALEQERDEGEGQTHEAQKRAEGEIPTLLSDVRGGRYVDVVARGNHLLGSGVLTGKQLATIHRALLDAYVALDAPGAAAAACAAARANNKDLRFDAHLVSPKIRAACASP